MTAKEEKENAFYPQATDAEGYVIGNYQFTTKEFESFCEALCREQREICADAYFDLCREYQDELHNELLTAPSPEL